MKTQNQSGSPENPKRTPEGERESGMKTGRVGAETPDKFLEDRVAFWVISRIGADHMQRRERAMRLLEEAIELAQAEGITAEQVAAQSGHVFARSAGDPKQEAGGVAVCLLAWCAATGNRLIDVSLAEIERIEAKPIEQIRGSLARKADADLVTSMGSTGRSPVPR